MFGTNSDDSIIVFHAGLPHLTAIIFKSEPVLIYLRIARVFPVWSAKVPKMFLQLS